MDLNISFTALPEVIITQNNNLFPNPEFLSFPVQTELYFEKTVFDCF